MYTTAHKIELKPNKKAREHFAQAAGVARFSYNWGLERWKELNKTYIAAKIHNNREDAIKLMLSQINVKYRVKKVKLPKAIKESEIRKQLNAVKKEQFPWMYEVTKCAPQQGIKNLGKALSAFFSGRSGCPQRKKKFRCKDSFYLDNEQCSVETKPKIVKNKVKGTISYIRIPKIGLVRMCENVRFAGKLMSVTISRRADKWYAAISYEADFKSLHELENETPIKSTAIDLGIKTFATLADGSEFFSPKAYKSLEFKLKKLQKSLSKKQKGSSNRDKARIKVARHHARMADIRKDFLHKLSTYLTKTYAVIGIEDLNVKGMMRNHCLAKAIADAGFSEFVRQLEYKAERFRSVVVKADRWFPSSKTCSCCGHKLVSLKLSVRKWECPSCGTVHDRDHNAAINLERNALETVENTISWLLFSWSEINKIAGSSSVRA